MKSKITQDSKTKESKSTKQREQNITKSVTLSQREEEKKDAAQVVKAEAKPKPLDRFFHKEQPALVLKQAN